MIELFNMIPDVDKDKLKEKCPDIETILNEYANGFIKFRYSYENFSLYGNQDQIINLMKVFKEYCKRIF